MSSIIPRDDQWVKLLYKDMTHRGYTWRTGLNQHPAPEPFTRGCHSGSFYITRWRDALLWIRLGQLMYWVADAEPHGPILETSNKAQTHSVTISNLRPLSDVFMAMSRDEQARCIMHKGDVIGYLPDVTPEMQLAAVRTHARAIEFTPQTRELQLAALVKNLSVISMIRNPDRDLLELVCRRHPELIVKIDRGLQTPNIHHSLMHYSVTWMRYMPGAPADYWRALVSSGRALTTYRDHVRNIDHPKWKFRRSDVLRIVTGWPGAVAYLKPRFLRPDVLVAATRAERAGAPVELMTPEEFRVWHVNLSRTCPVIPQQQEWQDECVEMDEFRKLRIQKIAAERKAVRDQKRAV